MPVDLKRRLELLQMGEAQGRLKPHHAAELERYREMGLAGATRGEMEAAKREAASRKMFDEASSVLSDIANARRLLGQTRLGAIGRKVGSVIPGTPAYNLDQALQSVRANVGFSKLAEMRTTSATGASGLGPVSDRENKLLQDVLGSLDIGQSEDELRRTLNKIEYHQKRLRMIAQGIMPPPYDPVEAERGSRARPAASGGSGGGLPRVKNDADFARLPRGAQFVAPDGSIRVKP